MMFLIKALVTLVTCTDQQATERIVVRGSLESSIAYNQASNDIHKAFDYSYNQMAFKEKLRVSFIPIFLTYIIV